MDPIQHLALHHVATLSRQPGEPSHLYSHFARIDDRRRRRRQWFTTLLRRERFGPPIVPPRVRIAR